MKKIIVVFLAWALWGGIIFSGLFLAYRFFLKEEQYVTQKLKPSIKHKIPSVAVTQNSSQYQKDCPFAWKVYSPDEELYVWASNLRLRKQPNLNSKVITRIPYGTKVKVLERTPSRKDKVNVQFLDTAPQFYDNKSFQAKRQIGNHTTYSIRPKKGKIVFPRLFADGHWLKIEFGGKKGFVFDAYLSRLPALSPCEECPDRVDVFLNDLVHLPDNQYNFDPKDNNSSNYNTISLNQGSIVYSKHLFKKNKVLSFRDLSFGEVLLVAKNIFGAVFYLGNEEGNMIFRLEGAERRIIKIKRKGTHSIQWEY